MKNIHLKKVGILILLSISILGPVQSQNIDYIDPMIGTDGIGHTFPGATTPFGMVQLSPSNDFKAWNWCSGYHYSDSILKGFAHTHISGPGLAAGGDILLMPTSGKLQLIPGTEDNPDSGYRSRFSHDKEKASAGYYSVFLDDYNINVELTATPRTGIHRYTFQDGGTGNVIIDPTHNIMEKVSMTCVEIVNSTTVKGYKFNSWGEAGKKTIYFVAEFSKSFDAAGVGKNGNMLPNDKKIESPSTIGFVTYKDLKKDEKIEVKVGISYVSCDGAANNLKAETHNKDFDTVHAEARSMWEDKISKIDITGVDKTIMRTFYTAMYHSFISPNLISDVDGKYVVEGKLMSSSIPQYSNYSTWDTYRALHPLFTIIEQEGTRRFISSLVSRHADANLTLPGWECQGFDNVCMIGYNTVSVISDAILKNIPSIDQQAAYAAMKNAALDLNKHSPNYDKNGMEDYIILSYVPDIFSASVSKTAEYNYFDWTLSQVAKKLDKDKEAQYFYDRSLGYRNLYDKNTGYLLPKSADGKTIAIDTTSWKSLIRNYVSGNIWGYSSYAPHDMKGLIGLHGGASKFSRWLDYIFSSEIDIQGDQHVDISGFIGKYGHGDEPSHQMPYLYAYAGEPWKTQRIVHQILTELYSDKKDGLINNEDLGQMSAWYIFSSFGFYPVCPGDLKYILGSPLLKEATINLENGKTFSISCENYSPKNIYIQKVMLNGKEYSKNYIFHDDIMNGGNMIYIMGDTPNKNRGTNPEDIP